MAEFKPNSQTAAKPVLIMGVVNVTPDSFSDGGQFFSPALALAQARKLIDDGADIIDVGAESSRPGAAPLSSDEEWQRLLPVLGNLRHTIASTYPHVLLSVDTVKPDIMVKAADLGVDIINDISGGLDLKVLRQLVNYKSLQFIAMHMHGEPGTMQKNPLNGPEAVTAVEHFFSGAKTRFEEAGFAPERLWLDPGIGFGKGDEGNYHLIKQAKFWAERYNLAMGVSRKSFIGRVLGIERPKDRDDASKMLEIGLIAAGVQMIRTHDVLRLRRLVTLMETKKEG